MTEGGADGADGADGEELVADGHDTLWDSGARHVEANLEEWSAALRRR